MAYELAAAGVGRLVLAPGGSLKPSDQTVSCSCDTGGFARIDTAVETLALNLDWRS